MKIRDINWGLIGTMTFTIAAGIFVIWFFMSLAGCTQAIVVKPDGTRYQWNTFFQKLDIGRIRTANILLEGYSEEPGKAKVTVNPWEYEYEAEIGEGGYNERWRKLWQRYDAENGDDK